MNIRDKSEGDAIAVMGMPNNYVRWALEAIEEVAGKNGLIIILREAGLETLGQSPPPDNDDFSGLTMRQYADLNAAILNFFGRAAKSMTVRIGRVSARRAIDQQAKMFNIAAMIGLKVMPLNMQHKLGWSQQQEGLRKVWAAHGQKFIARLEEADDAWIYSLETCAQCAGKASDQPMCWLFGGALHESALWLTGKEFEIIETECRAMGAPACVWRIGKAPKE